MSDIQQQHAHTNNLIHETSPYLLQHAHNPVNWYAWHDEALQKAKQEDKPILLSVGYSACHWCHVMERESFENEETAALMNENFVNIKVDREERPDIDSIYMQAVQAMTRQGGWPMTVFLMPDGRPFYGGTYFPPEDRHYGRETMSPMLIKRAVRRLKSKLLSLPITCNNVAMHPYAEQVPICPQIHHSRSTYSAKPVMP